MKELIWLNGRIMPLARARVSVEDRGFQFADGVYEVIRVYTGRPYMIAEHLERLERSCAGIELAMPLGKAVLEQAIAGLVRKSGLKDGMIYLQITRGASPRNHVFSRCSPTVLFYSRSLPRLPEPGLARGLNILPVPDERWNRCWIKSIALLPNVLAKNAAVAAGADEAAFVHDGIVTECSTSNLFIVSRGTLLTHPVGPKVLPGITRSVLLKLAGELGIPAVERPVSEAEVIAADEVFISSTTREVGWVQRWNGQKVGSGRCGPISLKLHQAYNRRLARELGTN